jgi:FixJ family two-component response regulator
MQLGSMGRGNTYVAVVDDDESLGRSVSRLLRAFGIQTVTYTSAEAFLEDANRPRFDCLLLDIQLEGISGVELGRRLAAVNDTTPAIYLTAHDEPEIRAQAMAVGCARYFRKTDPGEQLLEAIRHAVGHQGPNPSGPRSL